MHEANLTYSGGSSCDNGDSKTLRRHVLAEPHTKGYHFTLNLEHA